MKTTRKRLSLISIVGPLTAGIAALSVALGLHRTVLLTWKRILSHARHIRAIRARTGPDQRPPNLSQELVDSYDALLQIRDSDAQQYLDYTVPGETAVASTQTMALRSHVCASSITTLTIPPSTSAIAQGPGRRLIAMFLNSRDVILIITDDAPGLSSSAMLVEIDIDPVNMSGWNKAIEAWTFCRGRRVSVIEASMIGGFGIGAVCSPLAVSNDFRSGCTNTQTMLLAQQAVDELWFRKPGFWGFWVDVAVLDSSIWAAFGGRRVRFIWRFD